MVVSCRARAAPRGSATTGQWSGRVFAFLIPRPRSRLEAGGIAVNLRLRGQVTFGARFLESRIVGGDAEGPLRDRLSRRRLKRAMLLRVVFLFAPDTYLLARVQFEGSS